jgi:hypothetical protein
VVVVCALGVLPKGRASFAFHIKGYLLCVMTMLSMTITVMSTVGGTNTNLISTITGGIMPRTSVKRINTFIEMCGKLWTN